MVDDVLGPKSYGDQPEELQKELTQEEKQILSEEVVSNNLTTLESYLRQLKGKGAILKNPVALQLRVEKEEGIVLDVATKQEMGLNRFPYIETIDISVKYDPKKNTLILPKSTSFKDLTLDSHVRIIMTVKRFNDSPKKVGRPEALKPSTLPAQMEIIKQNEIILNNEFFQVAALESIGGNAGSESIAVNMAVSSKGCIAAVGNIQGLPLKIQEKLTKGILSNVCVNIDLSTGDYTVLNAEKLTSEALTTIKKSLDPFINNLCISTRLISLFFKLSKRKQRLKSGPSTEGWPGENLAIGPSLD